MLINLLSLTMADYVQVIVAGANDDWRAAHKLTTSPLHILTPTHLDIVLKKSLIDDSQYPK